MPASTEGLEQRLSDQLMREGLSVTRWSNAPHAVYAAHDHPYHKVLYVVVGGITFTLESTGRWVAMKPGDRLEIPPRTSHSAVVGPDGVTCLEGHRSR